MGAELGFLKIKAKRSELKDKADDLRDDARYDHGHSGYTGTIAEDNGQLDVVSTPMSEDEAYDYIEENAQKWEASLAIPVKDEEEFYFIGGIYSC
tara:strand:- start:40121 stop:40405 length:285 start_codon:yes stop_codon:yes gene_type:complete